MFKRQLADILFQGISQFSVTVLTGRVKVEKQLCYVYYFPALPISGLNTLSI